MLGFRRGISADETKKKHLKKDSFIAEKKKEQYLNLKQNNLLIHNKLTQQRAVVLTNKQKISEQNEKLNILKLDINLFTEQKKKLQEKLSKLTTKVAEFQASINQWLLSVFSNSNDKLTRYRAIDELNSINSDESILSKNVVNEISNFEIKAQLKPEEKLSNKIIKGNENDK
jgi:hypothetical protein